MAGAEDAKGAGCEYRSAQALSQFEQLCLRPGGRLLCANLQSSIHNVLPQGRLPRFRCQRSYDERIIRDDAELNRTRQHIIDIPTHWNQDERHAR